MSIMYLNLFAGKPLLGLLIGMAVTSVSCKSDPGSIFKEGHSDNPIVLVAGYSGTNGTNHVAKYWVDGQETVLTNGTNDAFANSISVSGSYIYIAGTESDGVNTIPLYWQNNTETKLPIKSLNGSANSIYVSGNKVYIAGSDSTRAVYWKDGSETVLDNTDSGSSANAVFVSGNDVYIAGTRGYNAVYWKNGNIVDLTGYEVPTQHVRVNGISVLNGDTYVVGYVNYAASPFPYMNYWANGVATDLNAGNDLSSPNNNFGQVCSVFASGKDLYIAGMVETTNQMINHAVYWKNDVETVLTGGATNTFACSIYVSGNDFYIAGYEYNQGQPRSAVYWKNGVEVKLTDGSTETVATSIFIK
jgi:LVIVD repeat